MIAFNVNCNIFGMLKVTNVNSPLIELSDKLSTLSTVIGTGFTVMIGRAVHAPYMVSIPREFPLLFLILNF